MGISLNVQPTSQIPPAVGGLSVHDATGCWVHSANMVRSYFNEEPINMPELYRAGSGYVQSIETIVHL